MIEFSSEESPRTPQLSPERLGVDDDRGSNHELSKSPR